MTNTILKISTLCTLLFLTACDKSTIEQPEDYQPILTNLGTNVILKTYEDLFNQTEILVQALSALENNPNDVNLESARQAWRDARRPWEQSEGFLFGPVDQQGLDPAIDSWPVNQPDLEAVLNSPNTLTKEYIDGLDGTLKGFHTIEYLIFGTNSSKLVSDFTTRQFEYLTACAESLHGATQSLYYSWNTSQQNFIRNILQAGQSGNSIYPSQKSALEELLIGLITIADEVANGKINDPLSQQNASLEESRFSANSKQDFADNIRSIQNVYIGEYGTTQGPGLSVVIASKSSTLDTKVNAEILAAINAIESIPGTFTHAIFNETSSVIEAQNKVRNLQLTLESEVLPIISNL